MTNCCTKNNDNKKKMMSDVEASLRAKLLLKCAEAADIKKEYENLKKEFCKLTEAFKDQKDKEEEYLDHIDDMNLQLHYYAGKISAYQDIVSRMNHV